MANNKRSDIFTSFTSYTAKVLGRPSAFIISCALLLLWALSGPLLNFSDTWQLVVNTVTTVITFLMVFIIQNTQNRDNLAINIKLDAALHKLKIDREDLLRAEDQSDKVLEKQREKAIKKSK